MSNQTYKYLTITADGEITAFKTSPIYYASSDMFFAECSDYGERVGYRKQPCKPTVYLLDEKWSEELEIYLNDVDNGLSLLLNDLMTNDAVEYEISSDFEDDFNEF